MTFSTVDRQRRTVLKTAIAGLVASAAGAHAADGPVDVTRATAAGQPGDFDFLTGEWRIHNRFLENGVWIEFPGEATVFGILHGIASIEELRIPARGFSGMGLRLLDVENRIWSDHWVNAKSGVVAVPGQTGVFVDGVGTFTSDAGEDEERVLHRGVWDRITGTSCRWYQGASRDGGKTWEDTWFMEWTRVAGA